MLKDVVANRLSPFRHRSFRLFFLAQTLSLVGTWSHDLARAWIIIEMMGKAGALGTLLLAVAIPSFMFILHGGVIVDRTDVRKVMIGTKSILAVASLALAAVVQFSEVQFWHLLVFGLIEGAVNAFDNPAYQAMTVRLVPRQDFQQALALNSTNFHSARMLGPLVAGALMAWQGPAVVFLFDALSYVALIFLLRSLDLSSALRPSQKPQRRWLALREGLAYIWSTPHLRYRVLQLLTTISLVYPLLIVIFRTYIQAKFDLNAEQFGYVFTIPALGSMAGALTYAIIKPRRPIRGLAIGVPLSIAMILLLPLMPGPLTSGLVMGLTGFAMYLSFASLTVSMHLDVEEEFRGRLGSVIGLCFLSIGPLMSFPLGFYADWIGFETAIISLASLFALGSALLAWLHRGHVRPRAIEEKADLADEYSQTEPHRLGYAESAISAAKPRQVPEVLSPPSPPPPPPPRRG